ncbi:MAG: hypothetical protein KGL39_19045 [Patescibacteria group bacterium]|nr:hypothetical protein [Patescibacteria group bacterium]
MPEDDFDLDWRELVGDSSQSPEAKAEREKQIIKRREKAAATKRAYDAVASTSDGILVLRHIYEETGYADRLTTLNQHTLEVNTHATLYNFARRDFWLDVVRYLTPQQRAAIEFYGE